MLNASRSSIDSIRDRFDAQRSAHVMGLAFHCIRYFRSGRLKFVQPIVLQKVANIWELSESSRAPALVRKHESIRKPKLVITHPKNFSLISLFFNIFRFRYILWYYTRDFSFFSHKNYSFSTKNSQFVNNLRCFLFTIHHFFFLIFFYGKALFRQKIICLVCIILVEEEELVDRLNVGCKCNTTNFRRRKILNILLIITLHIRMQGKDSLYCFTVKVNPYNYRQKPILSLLSMSELSLGGNISN